MGIYQVIYDIAVNACGLTMYINIDLLTEFCRPIQAICCHSTSNPAKTRRVQPVSFSLNCIETKQTSYLCKPVIWGNQWEPWVEINYSWCWVYQGLHPCTRVWVCAIIGLFKNWLSICQSGCPWTEIQNALPLIFWVCKRPCPRIFPSASQMVPTGARLHLWHRLELGIKI